MLPVWLVLLASFAVGQARSAIRTIVTFHDKYGPEWPALMWGATLGHDIVIDTFDWFGKMLVGTCVRFGANTSTGLRELMQLVQTPESMQL